LSEGGVGNSPLHISAKGRTTATVYRKGGAFLDFFIISDGFLWEVRNIQV